MKAAKIGDIKCIRLLLSILATVQMVSCSVWENDLYVPAEETDIATEVRINMNITAGRITTRAAEHKDRDNGTDADNFINIDGGDYCIYILDGGDNHIIEQFQPSSVQKTAEGYRLSGMLAYDPSLTTFRLMVMANWEAFDKDYSTNITAGSTMLSDLYGDRDNFNFTAYSAETISSWLPVGEEESNEEKRHGIPMFGLSEDIHIPKSVNGFVPELEVGSVPMLRALAKIEVVNATKDEDGVKISDCRLTKYNINGRLIPDGDKNPKWNDDETQVETPSFPNQTEQGTDLLFIPSEDGKTFTVYIPEMNVKELLDKPCIEVDASVKEGETKTYEIQLGRYHEGNFIPDSYLIALLRNHRYEFDVLSVSNDTFNVGFDSGIDLEDEVWDGWI